MPREMPVLAHIGDKLIEKTAFWAVPQDILVYAFHNLTYSETQLLIYLMGNKPGWQLSNLGDSMGVGDRSIRDSRRVLTEMGFIRQRPGPVDSTYETIEVDFDWIRQVVNNNWDKVTAKQEYEKLSQ